MSDQPTNVLNQQVDEIRKRCDFLEAQIKRDESLISDMIDYLSEGKEFEIENSDFCADFKPALSVQLLVFALPESVNCLPSPFQLKSKTLFMINNEIVLCLKLTNSSANSLFDVSGSVFIEDGNKNIIVSESRSIMLMFFNKSDINIPKQNFSWHKFCPIETDIVNSGQTVYLVVAFPPPEIPSSCSIVVYCASGKCEETFNLISCIEQHKWNRWQGVLSRFICDPWDLCAPNCFEDDNISSPDNFLMNICSLTAFSIRKKLKLYNTSELEKVFGLSCFKMDTISGQTNVLYSKLTCLSGVLVFVQNQDVDLGSFILCGNEIVLKLFLNKLTSMKIGFEEISDSNDVDDRNEIDNLLNEKIKIMKQLVQLGKGQSDDKSVLVDGIILRNITTNLVSLELKRLCLSEEQLDS